MEKVYSREELISLCKDSVVHHSEWENRDSYSAQCVIQSIYEGLTSGLDFEIDIHTNENTIWISFVNVENNLHKLKDSEYLEICSREDYFQNCDMNMICLMGMVWYRLLFII